MTLALPEPQIAVPERMPQLPEDVEHRVSPWGVQRNLEALAAQFPLQPGDGNFAQVPQCRAFRNTTQTITSGANTALQFNDERWDLGAPAEQHDTVTNNTRLTCVVPGLYVFDGSVEFAANVTGHRGLYVRVGGTNIIEFDNRMAITTAAEPTRMTISGQWRLAATEYLELVVQQTSGGNLNVTGGSFSNAEFAFHWVSP